MSHLNKSGKSNERIHFNVLTLAAHFNIRHLLHRKFSARDWAGMSAAKQATSRVIMHQWCCRVSCRVSHENKMPVSYAVLMYTLWSGLQILCFSSAVSWRVYILIQVLCNISSRCNITEAMAYSSNALIQDVLFLLLLKCLH